MLLIGKRGARITTIFCQDYIGNASRRPPQNLISKERAQWNTSWARLPKFEVSMEPIISQSLFVNLINIIMFMEQIFQDISK
jgi:hypothetical protein